MSAHNVSLCVVLSDARRIIKANRGHFLVLSLLFVLPLSFSAIMYPSLLRLPSIISSYSRFVSSFTPVPEGEIPPVDKSDIIFTVICFLFELLFSFFTTASITLSILNGFFGEPLKLTSSLNSVLVSLLPLTVTYIVSRLILGLIFFVVLFFSWLMYGGILLSGAETNYPVVVMIAVLLTVVTIYFQVEWYLADLIVVVESKWGCGPLGRSSYLVNGMRGVAFSIIVLFSLLPGISIMSAFISRGSVGWVLVLQTVAFTGIAAILKLYSVAATAVLFVYCKELREELDLENDDEFAALFAQLPYDSDGY